MEQQVKNDLKNAQLEKANLEVATLRLLLSELTYLRVSKGLKDPETSLDDSDVVSVVQREIKKRKEAAEGFRKGGREDSALKEEEEIVILEKYLPAQLSDQELQKIVEEVINNTGASTLAEMGKVIGLVMSKVGQGADGGRVSSLVKAKLS